MGILQTKGFGLEMSARGMTEITTYLERVDKELDTGTIIREEFEVGSRWLLADARELAPVDKGELRDSLRARVEGRGVETLATVFSPLRRAVFSEKGTRPHWPPIAALQGWAVRHGFPAKGGAFLVARSIARKGTPAFEFMKGSIEKNQRKIVRRIVKAIRDILRK